MGLGPAYAIHSALKKANLKLGQMDVVEINEAFAAQVISVTKAMASKEWCAEKLGASEAVGEVDPAKLNPNGGAIALGHPLGMSGARLVLTAARELRRRRERYALCTMCIGVGQGIAMLIERA
jgi:acetyl-CoA acetyltransferase